MVDVVTLGETMLRLSPANVSSLEEAQQLQVDVAGAESNVAVGLARMGLSSGWISKLVDNAVGRLIARRIGWHGVDISRVVWAEQGRNGLYYLEPGIEPRPTKLIYDRAGSAFTTLQFDQLDWAYITGAKLIHLSGITPALGKKIPGPDPTGDRKMQTGRAAGFHRYQLPQQALAAPKRQKSSVTDGCAGRPFSLFHTRRRDRLQNESR